MTEYQEFFVELLLENEALKLENPNDPEGMFTLKSGRRSPFFMNLGELNTGMALTDVGAVYAETVHRFFGDDVDVFFGPAYKGIPLAVVTSGAFDCEYGTETRYCSNRKEMKDHGDSGILLGTKLKDGDRVVIIEDVTTSGKSLEETIPILKAQAKVDIKGLVVAFDRMEYGHDKTKTALEEVAERYGIETHAIVSMADVLAYLDNTDRLTDEMVKKFAEYYRQYGPEVRK